MLLSYASILAEQYKTLHMAWSGILEEPKAAVKTLAGFVYEGMEPPSAKQLKRAERHIQRG